MARRSVHLLALMAFVSSVAVGCDSQPSGETKPESPSPTSGDGNGGPTDASGRSSAITWCHTTTSRTGTVAGTSLDYPSEPYTTWFNTSLEEVALSAIDEQMMKEVGLSPDDDADVRRFRYFVRGFDFRWIVADIPSDGNWFSKTDLTVYLFDVADTATPMASTVEVYDASAVREARLSGDKSRLGSTLRTTIDAMKAIRRPKAIVAFAPDRIPESSLERAFINLFARNVYFATKGSVTLSNLHDVTGAPVTSVVYPMHNVRTLDVSARGEIAGSPFAANGSCLDLRIGG